MNDSAIIEDSLIEYQTKQEALNDYLEAFPDALHDVEHSIHTLTAQSNQTNHSAEINTLFRALHTVKSNAAMCQLSLLVNIAHPLEDLVGAIRAGTLSFNQNIGEIILMVMDRMHQAAQYLQSGHTLEPLQLNTIRATLLELSQANNQTSQLLIPQIIELITGQSSFVTQQELHPAETDIVCLYASQTQQNDLRFFRQLSQSMEQRSPFWEGRTSRLLRMAVETNQAAGKPTDPVQLEAAVYMHDIGMGLLSESILNKQGKLNELELRALRRHPHLATGILERMSGWEEAAQMVAQHHEKLDGTGYPAGLHEHQICHGAKLLAILDAFEAMTHQRIDRNHKKSVLRAISELNACDTQFHSDWVKSFNQAVRHLLESI